MYDGSTPIFRLSEVIMGEYKNTSFTLYGVVIRSWSGGQNIKDKKKTSVDC